jgi:hypothetical protein
MAVRPLAHASADVKAKFYSLPRNKNGKTSATEGSKTQKRKKNKESHMKNNTAGMR